MEKLIQVVRGSQWIHTVFVRLCMLQQLAIKQTMIEWLKANATDKLCAYFLQLHRIVVG